MTRVVIALLLWFGVAIGLTQVAGAALEAWRTKPTTEADAVAALAVRSAYSDSVQR